ncbi:hypothetical protein CYLTODRAFT_425046 [Cylindrobasidium torrendii FP15055 ss-10]|uniref:Uncharacterized protein n=1 Tax=Cylindrobasidium torrendii FP15055 ss-10 TaxID=1314674 RepID=A0A0D7B2B1_9AGAR|nr:hypothetical protein CYLTODRAFT_425046 [Cylindrobasidium torrendii FP15055 ss-10]
MCFDVNVLALMLSYVSALYTLACSTWIPSRQYRGHASSRPRRHSQPCAQRRKGGIFWTPRAAAIQ